MSEQPTERQLKALRAIQQAGLGSAAVNRQDAEECTDRGWAETMLGGGYRLTEAGRQVLRNSN
jgi:hypothetical protein